jgi:predicted AlkP superfamily pyrophosphatase or phosphodiesterase
MSEDSEAEPFIPRSDTFDLAETAGARKSARKGIIPCFGMIVFAIVGVVFFGAGVGVGYLVWSHTSSPSQGSVCSQQTLKDEICANPPVLQISIDGYWAGYYPRDLNPNLHSLAENGVRAEYMRSQYPTKTFPNHFSIVTGLFPESHGIVDNTFIDKHLKETFKLSNRDQTDSKWWLGEPVWITAQKQDLISGVYFWPGSETDFNGSRPHFYFEYTDKAPYQLRVDTVLSWFDLQNTSRPQYMAMYFNEPDHTGHSYGPNSPEVNAAIANVDYYLGLLIRGLKQRGIFDCVNIIITSDHGMASTPANQTIPFDTSLPKGASALIRGTSVSLTVDSPADKEEVYRMFKYPNGSTFHPKVEVYYQWEVPVRFHVGHSLKWRYGDILMIPKVGWILGHHSISATHGYDNNAEEMQAIFFAHGPAFQKGIVVPAFDNIEVYNLVCGMFRCRYKCLTSVDRHTYVQYIAYP